MTRLEKCIALKDKGYTYAPETGKVYGVSGKEIKRTTLNGYIEIAYASLFQGNLKVHHFAWFMMYGNVDFEVIDHINQIKTDNRISNLRIVSIQKNTWNSKSKGYSYDKKNNKWRCRIMVDNKTINLGYFNTEEEASQAYIKSKKIYHNI